MDYPDKVKLMLRGASDEDGFVGALTLIRLMESVPSPETRERGGNWEFDAERLVLVHSGSGCEVGLAQMNSSAEMLDWIFQVSAKTRASRQDVGDLGQALDNLLDSQPNLRSGCLCGGREKRFNAAEHVRECSR